MITFLSANWLWIVLIGGMLVMHLGHSGQGSGGCGHGGHGGHAEHGDAQKPSTAADDDGGHLPDDARTTDPGLGHPAHH